MSLSPFRNINCATSTQNPKSAMLLSDPTPELSRSIRAAKCARNKSNAAFKRTFDAGVAEGRAQAAARIYDALRALKDCPEQAESALAFLRLTIEKWHPNGRALSRTVSPDDQPILSASA